MENAHDQPTPATYFMIFIALMILLVLTTGVAFIDLDKYLHGHFWSLTVALLIAIAKAALILLYFMHIKFGPRQVIAFALAGFFWLGILLTLSLGDYLTRNHPSDLNYKGEPRYLLTSPAASRAPEARQSLSVQPPEKRE